MFSVFEEKQITKSGLPAFDTATKTRYATEQHTIINKRPLVD